MNAEQKKIVQELIDEIDRRIAPPVFDSIAACSALMEIIGRVEAMADGACGAAEHSGD